MKKISTYKMPGVACYALRTNTKIFCSSCVRVQKCYSWTIFCQKFCLGYYNKIFFVFVLYCKKMFIFSIRGSKKFSSSCCFAKPKIFIFVFLKKLEKQNLRVSVFKKCACTKNLHVRNFLVSSKSWRKKNVI